MNLNIIETLVCKYLILLFKFSYYYLNFDKISKQTVYLYKHFVFQIDDCLELLNFSIEELKY